MYKIILAVLLALPAARQSAAQSAPAHANEQQEFLRLLYAVQTTPEDDAAREKLLRYVSAMRRKPPVPVEAKKYYIRGVAIHIDAVNIDEFDKAARAYNKALEIAPWWGQCYYNLAKALESANRFEEAESAMRNYKLLNVSARAETGNVIAAASKTTARGAPRAPAAVRPDFRGSWGNGLDCWRYEFKVSGEQLTITMRCWDFDGAVYGSGTVSGRHFEGSSSGGASGTGVGVRSPIRFKGDISEDDQVIEISTILAPELAETAAAQAAARDQVGMFGESTWQSQTWRHMSRD